MLPFVTFFRRKRPFAPFLCRDMGPFEISCVKSPCAVYIKTVRVSWGSEARCHTEYVQSLGILMLYPYRNSSFRAGLLLDCVQNICHSLFSEASTHLQHILFHLSKFLGGVLFADFQHRGEVTCLELLSDDFPLFLLDLRVDVRSQVPLAFTGTTMTRTPLGREKPVIVGQLFSCFDIFDRSETWGETGKQKIGDERLGRIS